MKKSDRFVEWLKDWFVYESMTGKDGQLKLYRFYPLITRRFVINVIYWEYDGGYHNHLWPFGSIILYGGYIEHFMDKPSKVRKALSMGRMRIHDFHTVELITDKSISIMIRGKQVRPFIQYNINGKVINEVRYWKNKGYTRHEMLDGMLGHLPRKWRMPKFLVRIVDKHRNPLDREKYR